MPEHSPAPLPDRSVYGFVMYLGTYTLLFIYLVWAFVPEDWLKFIGLTYWPQKYWALAVPVYATCTLLLMVYVVLPGLSFLTTVPMDSPNSIHDIHAQYLDNSEKIEGIPPMADIHISEVCQNLYLSPKQKKLRLKYKQKMIIKDQ